MVFGKLRIPQLLLLLLLLLLIILLLLLLLMIIIIIILVIIVLLILTIHATTMVEARRCSGSTINTKARTNIKLCYTRYNMYYLLYTTLYTYSSVCVCIYIYTKQKVEARWCSGSTRAAKQLLFYKYIHTYIQQRIHQYTPNLPINITPTNIA